MMSIQERSNIHQEGQPDIKAQSLKKGVDYADAMKDLNSKILSITMTITEHYPELSKYLDEVPATIPIESNPEMTLSHLLAYYESLNSILGNYKLDHP